jgi:capsid protein
MKNTDSFITVTDTASLTGLGGGRLAGLSHYYDAVDSNPRRKSKMVVTMSEDRVLRYRDRQVLSTQTRDLLRNFAVAGFAVRKHLQYNSSFSLQCKTPDETLNRKIEGIIRRWGRRKNCHIAERHNFNSLMRLMETHIVLDGDVLAMWCRNGKLQIIEADRIRDPHREAPAGDSLPASRSASGGESFGWVNGVLTTPYGANTHYSIWKRMDFGNFEPERIIRAENAWLLGDFSRNDQIRGVSPLAPAVVLFSQLHDSLDYALAKAKLSQLMGLVTKRQSLSPIGLDVSEPGNGDGDDFSRTVRESFGDGIAHLDMDLDDSVEMFESKNPSTEFQNFCEQVIRLAFASLDIPYSFLDGSKTNYYGSEGEFEQYIDDCRKRQEPKLEFLQELTERVLIHATANGELDDAVRKGWTPETLADCCTWTGASIPVWRMLRYIKEYSLGITNGLLNPVDVCEMHDLDFADNILKMRQARNMAHGENDEERLDMTWEKPVYLTWDLSEPAKTNVGM